MTDRYTDQEIIELYRRGRRDPHILDKLRDLTLLPEDKLLSILHLAGEALEISRTQKKDWTFAENLRSGMAGDHRAAAARCRIR